MSDPERFDAADLDLRDPDPWLALYLDQSIPIDLDAKQDLLRSMRRPSRKALLPFVRPLGGLAILAIGALRIVLPDRLSSSSLLHRLICWGLRNFVAPEANRLILRHFHIGTEILNFIKDNVPDAAVETVPLRPRAIDDLKDHVFLQHDLNIFNFVIQLNAHLKSIGSDLAPLADLRFEAISDDGFGLGEMPAGRLNKIDLQTAVISYTPIYQLFLSDNDFWRASNSLQLDETIAIYIAKLTGNADHLALARNGHPMLPLSTLNAGFRLMLHGLAAEQLHYHLRLLKRKAAEASAA